VTSDVRSGQNLAQQIGHFGYQVQMVKDINHLENAVAKHISIAILVDISSSDEPSSNVEIFDRIQQWRLASIPFMFISDRDNQIVRLQAIRADGVAFFPKPVDVVSLVDKLDQFNTALETDPYRVLIVEDQPTIANYYQMILNMAGMATEVVTDPLGALRVMSDFNPDLVLMDLYMPESSGVELAKLIRQIDDYVSIPIVFLSSEDDFSKQMEAMELGGDDFLTKPIKAGHLVAMVRTRLERLRILRSYMVRDSLTGLLNHTSFRGQLKQEVNRCNRQGTGLSLAMLDIDHFKKVNDTYGHATGDSVLKSLSRLLRQRLRKSDIIGRYGGEEFVVMLLDADGPGAVHVMNEIRTHFAEVQHFSPNLGLFTVTFSCGVAVYPQFSNAVLLNDAADRALYAAKAAGRNRTILAES
jgi:diguanylate cyclase (GGDEF)-like protein